MAPPRTRKPETDTPTPTPGSVQRNGDGQPEEPREGEIGLDLPEALLAFQAEMPTVARDQTAVVLTKSGGQYSYKYADLASVVRAAGPAMQRHGLVFTSSPRHVANGAYELVGRLLHAPSGEWFEGALPLFGRTMQELGSSITYARRYLLGCLTGIITDEDPDAPGDADRSDAMEMAQAAHAANLGVTLEDERDRAWRRWSASVENGTQQQFMSAICSVKGKAWEALDINDFRTFWQGMAR